MIKGYYFITDSGLSKNGNISDVGAAIKAGVEIVQYREKIISTRAMHEEALALKKICGKAKFIINDRLDIALSMDADGVHIGHCDMPYEIARKLLGKNKIIGVTVHNVNEALRFEKKGADYLGLSPIFPTSTKIDAGSPCGVAVLREVKRLCSIPVVAIGGITLGNAKEVVAAGADAICAISSVVMKDDAGKEIKKFQELFG